MILLRQAEVGQTVSGQEFAMKDAKEAFKDWKVYVMAVCQFCSNTTLYAFSVFLPTIIRETGDYSVAEVQWSVSGICLKYWMMKIDTDSTLA